MLLILCAKIPIIIGSVILKEKGKKRGIKWANI